MTGVSIASVAVLLVINATLKSGNTVAAKEDVEDRFLAKAEIEEEDSSSLFEGKQIKLTPDFGFKLEDIAFLCSQMHLAPGHYNKKYLSPFQVEMYRHEFDKRDKFNPWGGKRQGTGGSPKIEQAAKARFNPWGGRR